MRLKKTRVNGLGSCFIFWRWWWCGWTRCFQQRRRSSVCFLSVFISSFVSSLLVGAIVSVGRPFDQFAVAVTLKVFLPLALADHHLIAERAVKGGLLFARRRFGDGQRLGTFNRRHSAILAVRAERIHHSESDIPHFVVPLSHVSRVQPVHGRHLSIEEEKKSQSSFQWNNHLHNTLEIDMATWGFISSPIIPGDPVAAGSVWRSTWSGDGHNVVSSPSTLPRPDSVIEFQSESSAR